MIAHFENCVTRQKIVTYGIRNESFFLANGPRNSMMEEANASKGVNQNLMVQLPEWLLTSQR